MDQVTIVLGLGEIGRPLYELLKEQYETVGVDREPVAIDRPCGIMHVCYPYEMADFIGTTVEYMDKYNPKLTVINSTVGIGTTRKIFEKSGGRPVVNSPIRGKHATMKDHLKLYTKFIGAMDEDSAQEVARHFEGIGMKTKILPTPETTELAKLTETTYFGYLIAWAQEIERYASQLNIRYDDVMSYFQEVKVLPDGYFPGAIGGHCVMPNIKILKSTFQSGILDVIEKSNEMKTSGQGMEGWKQT